MPLLSQTRRDSVGSQTISKYSLGGAVGGTQSVTYIENPSGADRPPRFEDIEQWPGDGSEVVLDDGTTSRVTAALMSVSSILSTTIAPGAVLGTSTGFRGLPWQDLTAELEKVQGGVLPWMVTGTENWEIFRLDYTTFSEGSFTPSNASPSTDAFGISVGATGETGRWWTSRAVIEPNRLPTQSPDLYIFPQDINFAAADTGSVYVAVRAASSLRTAIDGESIGLYSWGYNGTAWRSRNHSFTSTSLGTCSFTDIASGAITAGKIADGAVTANKIATGAVTSPKLAVGAVLGTSIGNFAVGTLALATSAVTTPKLADASVTPAKTSFTGAAWQQHNALLGIFQRDFTPQIYKNTDVWRVYQLNYTLVSSTTFTPTNSPSLGAYGIALGNFGENGRWWSDRLVLGSAILPTQSADLYIFPQEINFLNPAGSGTIFVAVRAGSAAEAGINDGTLTLRTFGYSVSWTVRTHAYSDTLVTEVSASSFVSTGGGGGGGGAEFQYFTEALNTVGGVQYSSLLALATTESIAGVAIIPKDPAGPLVASVGGDARGAGANDLQRSRDLSSDVASGANSGLYAGRWNRASGARSFVVSGQSNWAATSDSAVTGRQGRSRNSNEFVFSGQGFDNQQGTSQGSLVVLRTNGDVSWEDPDEFVPLYFGSGSTSETFSLFDDELFMISLDVVATYWAPGSPITRIYAAGHTKFSTLRGIFYSVTRPMDTVGFFFDDAAPIIAKFTSATDDTFSVSIKIDTDGVGLPEGGFLRATGTARVTRHFRKA